MRKDLRVGEEVSVPGETLCIWGPKERRAGKVLNPQGAGNEDWGLPLRMSVGFGACLEAGSLGTFCLESR